MKAPKSMRVWLAFVGAILWTGIYLTGFANTHWFVYLPATGSILSAITGICPSQMVIFEMFGVKIKETSNQPSR